MIVVRWRCAVRPLGLPFQIRLYGGTTHRHQALFISLADHPQETFGLVDVRNLQRADFRNTQAAAIKDLQDCTVPHALPAARIHTFDNIRNFLYRKHFREISAKFRVIYRIAGIVAALPFQHQPVEKRPERTQLPGLAAFGYLIRTGRQIFRDIGAAHLQRITAGLFQECRHIRTIRRRGIGRHLSFHPQVIAVRF